MKTPDEQPIPVEAGKENEFAQVLASVPVETKKEVPVDLRDSLIQIQIAQDELQVLLERVKDRQLFYGKVADDWEHGSMQRESRLARSNQCLEIQRWIEDAMKGRPQKVEGDGFEEWRAQFPMFSETVIAIGESAVKDYIKWHAAKAKERGV